MTASLGTFPFGQPVRRLVQQDRTRKRVFVLGVYASAVHARWIGPDGRERVKALAVASEPTIFWDGSDAEGIINSIEVPAAAGKLVPAMRSLNGPSGRALDEHILGPLGVGREDAWLCDLVPHTCLNPGQEKAIREDHEPMRAQLGLPMVTLPKVPSQFADARRRDEVLGEVREAKPDVLVLLGDEPLEWWLGKFVPDRRRLGAFGETRDAYGRLHDVVLGDVRVAVLPLVHVRQAARLGAHSKKWADLHGEWRTSVAPTLLR